MIIYGGPKKAVLKQMDCDHDFQGPYVHSLYGRHYTCTKCNCYDCDLTEQEVKEKYGEDSIGETDG